tara:strand:+ start:374 stop:535 length:162 start_codon:yes stop_codon:yes gene_type:complete
MSALLFGKVEEYWLLGSLTKESIRNDYSEEKKKEGSLVSSFRNVVSTDQSLVT